MPVPLAKRGRNWWFCPNMRGFNMTDAQTKLRNVASATFYLLMVPGLCLFTAAAVLKSAMVVETFGSVNGLWQPSTGSHIAMKYATLLAFVGSLIATTGAGFAGRGLPFAHRAGQAFDAAINIMRPAWYGALGLLAVALIITAVRWFAGLNPA
jgi:hypothetical protein